MLDIVEVGEDRWKRIPLPLVDYIESASSVSKNGEEDRRARAMLLRLYGFRAAAVRPRAVWRELRAVWRELMWSLGPSPMTGVRRFVGARAALV
jgi:hypothetical protein